MDWQTIVFEYICPIGGCFLASAVFAAPIRDLNLALNRGSLGNLNTTPWAVMTGNCLGWCAYSYYTADPFVLASNLPGLILSLWLNIGACKIQYLTQIFSIESNISSKGLGALDTDRQEPSVSDLRNLTSIVLTSTPQEAILFGILGLWAIVFVCIRWFSGLLAQYEYNVLEPQYVVGILVNINLVFFYGAPLQTMKTVLATRSSDSIHTPTVTMNVVNAMFWMSYGLARLDVVIFGPNGVGLLLGICQVALCCIFPKRVAYAPTPTSAVGEETAEFRSITGSIT